MDYSFKKPTLEAYDILFKVEKGLEDSLVLVDYLSRNKMTGLQREYEERGILPRTELSSGESIDVDMNDLPEEDLLKLAGRYSEEVEYELFAKASRRLMEYNKSLMLRFDICTAQVRMLILLGWKEKLDKKMEEIESIIELGIDWGRKNKFKVYKSLYHILKCEYDTASNLLIDALSTFEGGELMTYSELVKYSLFCGLMGLSRQSIRSKLVESSEVCDAAKDVPSALDLLMSLDKCEYDTLFVSMCKFAEELRSNAYLFDKVDYFVYRMKVRSYNQLFMSYKAISIKQMSSIFGVGQEYMLSDVEGMILRGDLRCRINHQNMMVYKTPNDSTDKIGEQAEEILHTIQKMIASE
ncbi:26S proteasome regulatory subunit N7 [Nematocida minor]|uniref:26S proteasome regulatory subunit N7 n=1 Tax=Nematocida minor TaxID=1912983 RepID=UPI00221E93A8|nr:26S proteasome regulatory subunit N7 [Nematocida minor]KAI5190966.1 26S proteasome regulatory subunit N7 [Nematocida minor]